jgi:hypothetical protein
VPVVSSSRTRRDSLKLVGVLYGGGRPSAFQDVAQRMPSATGVGSPPFQRRCLRTSCKAPARAAARYVATVRHVEQSQLRLRRRSSRPTIPSGSPRRSITSRSVFTAQDVGQTSAEHHQPSRLSRCGEARHDSQHELAPRPERRCLEAGTPYDASQARQARLAALRRLQAQHHD